MSFITEHHHGFIKYSFYLDRLLPDFNSNLYCKILIETLNSFRYFYELHFSNYKDNKLSEIDKLRKEVHNKIVHSEICSSSFYYEIMNNLSNIGFSCYRIDTISCTYNEFFLENFRKDTEKRINCYLSSLESLKDFSDVKFNLFFSCCVLSMSRSIILNFHSNISYDASAMLYLPHISNIEDAFSYESGKKIKYEN